MHYNLDGHEKVAKPNNINVSRSRSRKDACVCVCVCAHGGGVGTGVGYGCLQYIKPECFMHQVVQFVFALTFYDGTLLSWLLFIICIFVTTYFCRNF